jgi:ketosteroid isomerase-like protein
LVELNEFIMKKILMLALFCLTMITVTSAQSADEKAVATAVESLRKAMIDADKTTLESLTADQLSYGHSSGAIEDKTAFVEAIVSGKSNFNSIELSEQTIRFAGNDAIVRHKFKAELLGKDGALNNVNIGILQVWQKQKGKWKLIARQAVKL